MILTLALALAATGLLTFLFRRQAPAARPTRRARPPVDADLEARILRVLAGEGCGACGHGSCEQYAAAVAAGAETGDRCLLGGADCARSIERILCDSRPAATPWTNEPAPSLTRVAPAS